MCPNKEISIITLCIPLVHVSLKCFHSYFMAVTMMGGLYSPSWEKVVLRYSVASVSLFYLEQITRLQLPHQ